MTAAALGVVVAAMALAAAAQALTGFGFSVTAVPLLTLAFSPADAVVLVTLASLMMTAVVTTRGPHEPRWDLVRGVLPISFAGVLGGVLVLLWVPSGPLTLAIGITVLVAAVTLRIRPPRSLSISGLRTAGLASGVLMTSTGLNGPPLVLSLLSLELGPREFRATLQAMFLGQNVLAAAVLSWTGFVSLEHLTQVSFAAPAAGAGWIVGDALMNRLETGLVRLLTLVMVALAGVATVVSGLAELVR